MKVLIVASVCLIMGLVAGLWVGFMYGVSRTMREAAAKTHDPIRQRRTAQLWMRIFAALAGVALVTSGFVSLFTLHFLHNATHAQGVVTDAFEHKDDQGKTWSTPSYRFEDSTGKEHTIRASWSTSPGEFRVGDKVEVLYSGSSPERARINVFADTWGTALMFALLAVVLSIGSLVFLFRQRILSG